MWQGRARWHSTAMRLRSLASNKTSRGSKLTKKRRDSSGSLLMHRRYGSFSSFRRLRRLVSAPSSKSCTLLWSILMRWWCSIWRVNANRCPRLQAPNVKTQTCNSSRLFLLIGRARASLPPKKKTNCCSKELKQWGSQVQTKRDLLDLALKIKNFKLI